MKVAILVVIFTSMLFRCVSAAAETANTNHSAVSVGGASGWDLSSNLQAWATHTTFHVGDSLVFRYTPVHDVLEVEKRDYDMCQTVDPMETHNDGETMIQLREVGDRYFICGRLGHCAMGLKLHVHVLPALQMTPGTANSTSPTSSPFTPPSNSTTTASGHDPNNNSSSSSSHGHPSDQVVGNVVPNSQQPADSNYSYDAAAGNTSTTSDAHARLIVKSSVTLLVFIMILLQVIHPCSPLLFLIPCFVTAIQLLVCS